MLEPFPQDRHSWLTFTGAIQEAPQPGDPVDRLPERRHLLGQCCPFDGYGIGKVSSFPGSSIIASQKPLPLVVSLIR